MRPESRSPLAPPPAVATAHPHRWRNLIGEAWRFSLVGIANVAINFVVFNALALTLFPGGELKANVIATAFATTSSYLMNRSWTFRHRKTSRVSLEYVLFFAFNAAGLAIELAVMAGAKYGLGLTTLWALNLAKLAGLGLATVFRFWTYRTFVFAGSPVTALPATAAASEPAAPAAPPASVATHGSVPTTAPGARQVHPVTPVARGGLATAPAGSPPGS